MTSLKGMTEEEKRLRKRKQKNEAQKRYYQKHKEYYKNYNKDFYKSKYEELKEKIDKAVEYINTWLFDEYSIAIQDSNNKNFCSTEPNAVDNLLNILQNGKGDGE